MEGLLSSLSLQSCSSKIKLDEFFAEYLSEDFQQHMDNIHELSRTKTNTHLLAKKSPKKRPHEDVIPEGIDDHHQNTSDIAMEHETHPLHHLPIETFESSNTTRRRANFDTIPIFFKKDSLMTPEEHLQHRMLCTGTCPRSLRIEEDQLLSNPNKLLEIETIFKKFNNNIPLNDFVDVTKYLCGFPSFFNKPLCIRLNLLYPYSPGTSTATSTPTTIDHKSMPTAINPFASVHLSSFLQFWHAEIAPFDKNERFFNLVKQPNANTIRKDDFVPFLHELLEMHPGLDFLESHEEFQKKYALTVITRIFYKVNQSRTGRISLAELRKSDLRAVFCQVDEETDINRVTEYFSYEHFYVLYCRFFELDSNKDSKLSREDLLRYNDRALSDRIVDRIFEVGVRVFSDGVEGEFKESGGMNFIDFVYFMLSEEDKTTDAALYYWFTCCDVDAEGVLSTEKMRHLFRTQLQRLSSIGQDGIRFNDALCQMIDLIKPKDACALTLQDLIDSKPMSGLLFDALFNFHKFLRFESRDPFQEKMKREDGFKTDWDRFASSEYARLCVDEDLNSYGGGSMEIDTLNSRDAVYSHDAKNAGGIYNKAGESKEYGQQEWSGGNESKYNSSSGRSATGYAEADNSVGRDSKSASSRGQAQQSAASKQKSTGFLSNSGNVNSSTGVRSNNNYFRRK